MGTILMMILVAIAVLVAAVAAFWPKDTRTHVVIRGDWRPASNQQALERCGRRASDDVKRLKVRIVETESIDPRRGHS